MGKSQSEASEKIKNKEITGKILVDGLTQENIDVLKFEQIGEILNWLSIGLIFTITKLPLTFAINQQALIYLISFYVVFTIFWYHLLPRRYSTRAKTTLGTIIYSLLTAALVHYSGGFRSPFGFFIYIPLIASAWGIGPRAVLVPTLILSAFFVLETKFYPIGADSAEKAENTIHLFVMSAALLSIGFFVYRIAQREHQKNLDLLKINLRLIEDEKMLREVLEEAISAKQKLESSNVELEKTKFHLLQTLQNITHPDKKLRLGPSLKKMKVDTEATLELISHRLNTPATVIGGNISMLLEGDYGKLHPEQEEVLRDIATGNERLKNIIADFINFLTLGNVRREAILTVNLPPVIEAAIAHVSLLAKRKNIEIIYKPTNLNAIVEGNNEKIQNIIIYILEYSILNSPRGGKISLSHYRNKKDIITEITNQAPPIPRENWEKIFEQFQASERILTGTAESTGLELHLARSFARLMNGDVLISRSDSLGNVVTFKLKAVKYHAKARGKNPRKNQRI